MFTTETLILIDGDLYTAVLSRKQKGTLLVTALVCLVCFVLLFRVTCAHVLYFFWKQLTTEEVNECF